MLQYRQGDVLVNQIEKLPEDAVPVARDGDIILAEGEVTGHAHRIKNERVRQFQSNNRLYLHVSEEAPLLHEEHATAVLKPGTYEVRKQVEVWLDEVRPVAD